MKKFILSALLMCFVGLGTVNANNRVTDNNKQEKSNKEYVSPQSNVDHINLSNSAPSNYVWICLGPSATKYHTNPKCKGLHSCSKEIKKVTKEYAENKLGRTLCGYCKKNN